LPPVEKNREKRMKEWESIPLDIRTELFGRNPSIEFVPLEDLTADKVKDLERGRSGVFSFLIIPAQIPIDTKGKRSSGIKIILLTGGTGYNKPNHRKSVIVLEEGYKSWNDRYTLEWDKWHFAQWNQYEKLRGEGILITTKITVMAPLPFLNTLIPTSSESLEGKITEKTFNKVVGKK